MDCLPYGHSTSHTLRFYVICQLVTIILAMPFLLGSRFVEGRNVPPSTSFVDYSSSSGNSDKPHRQPNNSASVGSARRVISNEYCLMQDLMTNYDPSIRPVYNPHSAVNVTLGFTLKKILDLDEKNQILTTNIWLEASWHDERLNWSSAKYGGIKSVLIPPHKVWLPDIVLYNSVDDYTSGYMPSLAMVYNNSRVFWGPVIRFRSACKIDITYFPFDIQMCKMKMASWAYTGLQLNLWTNSSNTALTSFVHNGEWELLAVQEKRNVVYYACCTDPFPDVTFTIVLRRKTKYYFMNILIPCILLSVLCLAGFLLPPDSGEKVGLGLSVLLTITVFMLMIADRMPHTSESISVISIYLMAVLSMSCMSVLSSVLVLSIHHQRNPKKLPSCLRRICLGLMRHQIFRFKNDSTQEEEDSGITTVPHAQPAHETKIYASINQVDFNIQTNAQNDDGRGDSAIYGETVNNKNNNNNVRIRQILSKYSNMNHEDIFTPRSPDPCHTFVDTYHDHHQTYRLSTSDDRFVLHHLTPDEVSHPPQTHITTPASSLPTPTSSSTATTHLQALGTNTVRRSSSQNVNNKNNNINNNNPINSLDPSFSLRETADDKSALVTRLASLLVEKEMEDVTSQTVFREWHDLAQVLDRILFTFFLTFMIVSTVFILQMRPPKAEL